MSRLPQQFGFTLMEVLVVIGLFAILATIGLFFSMDFFRTYTVSSEGISLVSTLSKARARSLANVNENWHGVRITNNEYILFQGGNVTKDWDHRDTSLDQSIPVGTAVDATDIDIVFDQLSGNAATCPPPDYCTINLSGLGNGNKTVIINQQGAILW